MSACLVSVLTTSACMSLVEKLMSAPFRGLVGGTSIVHGKRAGTPIQNLRKPKANNTSGFLGVTFCRCTNRWLSQIHTGGKNYKLGRFDEPELAHAAYLQAKRRLHEGSTL